MGRPINEELERRKQVLHNILINRGFVLINEYPCVPLLDDTVYLYWRPQRGRHDLKLRFSEKWLGSLSDEGFHTTMIKIIEDIEKTIREDKLEPKILTFKRVELDSSKLKFDRDFDYNIHEEINRQIISMLNHIENPMQNLLSDIEEDEMKERIKKNFNERVKYES